MLRRLDKLTIKSFVGPFIVTFAIAVFVLMMQVLWLYLDDIAGKGLGFFTVIELMAYKCVGLVPLALPLSLLISSVMVLGGMAEHYELSSVKSAGVSLLRVMRPLIVFGVIAAGISFACADYLIPVANLQFGSRMYDIQQKKPTLNMEPGVFNEDFNQFAIRIGGRADNGRDITDVLIYDHTRAATGELGQIVAKRGEMYSSDDGSLFIMKLYDGVQYSEQRPGGKEGRSRPFVRTAFDSYTKVFDLSEFQLGVTSQSLFKTNRSMLATWQLQVAVDSIEADILIRKQGSSNNMTNYLPLYEKDTIIYRASQRKGKEDYDAPMENDSLAQLALQKEREEATARRRGYLVESQRAGAGSVPKSTVGVAVPKPAAEDKLQLSDSLQTALDARNRQRDLDHPLTRAAGNWHGVDAVLDSLTGTLQNRVWNKTRSAVSSIKSQAKAALRVLPGVQESRVKHVYDLHMKYSMALVCIIFIFIGAPMGAIVRKGGFGYPILVSIIFFVIFIILTIFCRKLAESFVVDAAFAGWMPCLILFPVSLYITRRAMRDAKLVNLDSLAGGMRAVLEGLRGLVGG